MTASKNHGQVWDGYVNQWREGKATPGLKNPGDHWGTPNSWRQYFDHLILQHVPKTATKFIEIGQGSGKYTKMILESYPNATMHCYDVSVEFLKQTRTRLVDYARRDRLRTFQITNDYKGMLRNIMKQGWRGKVDCICSFDALVHVDIQYMIAYLLTAMETLKIDGILAMTLADVTTDGGFAHLLSDLPHVFPFEGRACMQFRWMSPETIRSILERLGFEVSFMEPIGSDMEVVARLKTRKQIEW